MNPILAMLNRKQTPQQINSINDLLAGVKNGSINPKAQVMSMINNMSDNKKAELRSKLPAITDFANRFGIDTSALKELQF